MTDKSKPSRAAQLAKIQAISGLVFSLFVFLHLVNTALAALGPEAYNGFQRAIRPIYQQPLIEVFVVLTPLVVHIVAGVLRVRARPSTRGAKVPPRLRWHRYSGYFLAFFVFGHIAATRLPSLLRDAYPEFMGVAYTFQFAPYYFYPYYVLLALAGLYHMLHGSLLAFGILGVQAPRVLRQGPGFWVPTGASALMVMLGVAGVGGLLFAIPDASAYAYPRVVQEVLLALGL